MKEKEIKGLWIMGEDTLHLCADHIMLHEESLKNIRNNKLLSQGCRLQDEFIKINSNRLHRNICREVL